MVADGSKGDLSATVTADTKRPTFIKDQGHGYNDSYFEFATDNSMCRAGFEQATGINLKANKLYRLTVKIKQYKQPKAAAGGSR